MTKHVTPVNKYYKIKTKVEPAPYLLVDPFSTLTSIFLKPYKLAGYVNMYRYIS